MPGTAELSGPAGLPNTDKSMPEQKCRPTADSTMTLASVPAETSSAICGSSLQKGAIIEFAFSGRFIVT